MKKMEKLAIEVVRFASSIMLAILFLYSICNTVFLKDIEEHCFFLQDSPIISIAAIGCIFCVGIVLYRMFEKRKYVMRKEYASILLILSFLLGMGWILISQAKPTGDSMIIFGVANSLFEGNPVDFEKGAYMYVCPNQKGIVLFCYFLQIIAGPLNYLFFQFLNVIALVCSQWFIYKIVYHFSKNIELSLLVLMAEVVFLPAIIYTSFTYGTMLGFVCVAGALWFACEFWAEYKVRSMISASLLIALAVWFKSNYAICLIGLFLVSLVFICKKRNWKTVLLPIGIVLSYILVTATSEGILDELTGGLSRDNTFIATAYIEMGLQESTRAPGWFNGYAYKVCQDADYEEEVYKAAINIDIKNTLSNFAKNPEYAYSFFAKKIISQWCEPTFQSMWIVLVRESLLGDTSILRYWLVGPYSGANILIRNFLNVFQSIIYMGAFLYVLLERRKNIIDWTGMVIVLGGFLFHIMWEGKAQYTINYFMILIPYGLIGIYYLIGNICTALDKKTVHFSWRENCHIWITAILIFIIIMLAGVSFANIDDIRYYNDFMIYG